MNSDHESKMSALLRGSRNVNINGDVHVDAVGPIEFVKWIHLLPGPATFAWRSTVTGERYLQVCGSSSHIPVHGRVTVLLDGDRHRDLWDALFEEDLKCGEEQPVNVGRLLQLTHRSARTTTEQRSVIQDERPLPLASTMKLEADSVSKLDRDPTAIVSPSLRCVN